MQLLNINKAIRFMYNKNLRGLFEAYSEVYSDNLVQLNEAPFGLNPLNYLPTNMPRSVEQQRRWAKEGEDKRLIDKAKRATQQRLGLGVIMRDGRYVTLPGSTSYNPELGSQAIKLANRLNAETGLGRTPKTTPGFRKPPASSTTTPESRRPPASSTTTPGFRRPPASSTTTPGFRRPPASSTTVPSSRSTSTLSSPANASLSTRMSGANQIYKQQVKSGDIQGAKETGVAAWRMANPDLAKSSDDRLATRGTSATTNRQMSGLTSRLPTPQEKENRPSSVARDVINRSTANLGQPQSPQSTSMPTLQPRRAPSRAAILQQSYNYNLHPEVIEDVSGLYQSIYEGKSKKIDQDVDGDKDFADVMIARMIASGMSRDEAIRRVKNKEYNLRNEDINEAAPALATAGARLAPMLARLGPAAGRMKPLLKRGAKLAGREVLASVMDPNKKEQTPQEKEQENKNQDDGVSNAVKKGLTSMYKMGEEYEMVIGYLIDEGYADSLGAAELILENMSDEWLDKILNNY